MRDISAFTFSSSRVLYGLGPLWILVSNVGVDSPIRGGTTTRSRLVGLFTCRLFGIPHSVTTCGATILSIVAWDHGAEAFRSMIQVFSHMQDSLQPISWPVIGFTLNVSGRTRLFIVWYLHFLDCFFMSRCSLTWEPFTLHTSRKWLENDCATELIFIEPDSVRSRVRVSAKRSLPNSTSYHRTPLSAE